VSAVVDYAPYAWCHDCAEGSEVGITRDEAAEWAANHDAENHNEDDPAEIARQEWKDSRNDTP